jgi:predicted nucleotidyltransferase
MAIAHYQQPLARVRAHAAAIHAIVQRHGGTNPRVFGSVARGDACEGSDVDFLVDNVRLTLFDLVDMQDDLAALLGMDVDVVVDEEVRARSRPIIERDALAL